MLDIKFESYKEMPSLRAKDMRDHILSLGISKPRVWNPGTGDMKLTWGVRDHTVELMIDGLDHYHDIILYKDGTHREYFDYTDAKLKELVAYVVDK